MFNFLVTGYDITAPRGSLVLGADRVFNHTDKELEGRYNPGDVLDQVGVMALPTIFTNESPSDPSNAVISRVGKITKIRRGPKDYQIEFTLDAEIPPIPNAVLESLAAELNFVVNKKFFDEFHTNHWAVKDVDLFRVLFTYGIGRIKPTIFKLPEEPIDPKLAAVMMPFDAGFNGVYRALQDAIAAAGMRCLRADNIWDDEVIIQDVVKLIGTSRVVICDLTNKNANVFYETGIAHTLGQDVILIAQHESDVPFDLRHIRHIRYLQNAQGLEELADKVSKRLTALAK
ncbi:MAG TPA: hypothetical protein VGQ93_05545 [Lysobacter sp.]|jgi:hypothetical protein|nr:hypothetical protein [Lysobacter sp.]